MRRLIIMAPILLALPLSAWAEKGDLPYRTNGFYVGAGLGYGQVQMSSGPLKITGEDIAYKAFVGYRLPYSPAGINVAIEGGYVDLGNIHDEPLGSVNSLTVDGLDLAALAFFPILHRWDMFAKAGAFFWDAELKGFAPGAPEYTDTASDTDLLLGLGASYNTGTALGFRAEVESRGALDGAWTVSVSGIYQFK
jgi:hypothetical protein